MNIIGLGGSLHDFSACLVRGGQVEVAIEAERLTRKKHSIDKRELGHAIVNRQLWKLEAKRANAVLERCIDYCLAARGLEPADVDCIVSTDTNTFVPSGPTPFHRINHHLAHAASAFLPSGFDRAAILVVDGHGSMTRIGDREGYESVTFARGRGTQIEVLDKVFDHSLGHFYEAVTMGLDFGPLEEGKTMGLAPWGRPSSLKQDFARCLRLVENGQFVVTWTDAQIRDFVAETWAKAGDDAFQAKADIAYAAQSMVEDCMLHLARHACRLAGEDRLCIAGGVGLNSVANAIVARELKLADIFVQPAAGDNGLAMGAALHVAFNGPGRAPLPQRAAMTRAGLGKRYARRDVDEAIRASGSESLVVSTSSWARTTAKLLARGLIGGWFQGGSEFGPRALGFRSILADPRLPDMKEILNARVKHREFFRPFAPAVLAQHRDEYFDLDHASPFMLLVAPVRAEKRSVIPAVVHVDGTGRVQTVTYDNNPEFYELLENFQAITGVPVLLNTSFNDREEPIVESPADALRAFRNLNLDFLTIGEYVLIKPNVSFAKADEPARSS